MPIYENAVLFYNTDSGQSRKGRQLDPIKSHFENRGISLKIVKFPLPDEDIQQTISNASCKNADLIVAAGGDGTVSLISNKLIGSEIPLGILPLGTGNLLAQELKIPLNLEKALNLITTENPNTIKIDTIKLEDRICLLNVSVGITPKVMKRTQSKEKQRFGILAYLVHFIQQFLGLKLHRFFIDFDDQKITFHATEVLVTNGQSAGVEGLKWSDQIAIDDGRLDLFIIRATNISDVFRILMSFFSKKHKRDGLLKYIQFSDHCRIETETPIPTQVDGDTIGQTPVNINILHNSLKIIVAENYNNRENKKGTK